MKTLLPIDLIRTFSILSVMALHLGFNTLPPSDPTLASLWAHFAIHGMYGVYVFFMASGFLITRSLASQPEGLLKPDLRRFYVGRIGRLLPLLAVMLVFGALTANGVWGSPHYLDSFFHNSGLPFDGSFWGSILLFSFNWQMILKETVAPQGYGLYWGILWTLSVEEQFYLFYPLLLRFIPDRSSLLKGLAALVLLAPLVRWAAFAWDPHRYFLVCMNSLGCFGLIATGASLYLCQEEWKAVLNQNPGWCWGLSLAGLALSLVIYFGTSSEIMAQVWGPELLGLAASLFLLGALNLSFYQKPFFAALAFPGKLSYGLYLFHIGLLYAIWPWIPSQRAWQAYGIFVGLGLLVAWMSYRYFERPLNNAIRKAWGS